VGAAAVEQGRRGRAPVGAAAVEQGRRAGSGGREGQRDRRTAVRFENFG
jgi:hypothetical protein